MGGTLTEQRRVNDEGLRVVKFCCKGRTSRIGNDARATVLYIESQGEGAVFYTLDGTEPTEKSNLYSGPITLRPGIYTIKAFFINRYGLKSNTVTGAYKITED